MYQPIMSIAEQSPTIPSFTAPLAIFKDACKGIALDISQPLTLLETTFVQEVRLSHPRDIFPIYRALNVVSDQVANSALSDLKTAWQDVLNGLHQRKIYKIGVGESLFDVSVALSILETDSKQVQKKISVALLDLQNAKNRSEVVNYIRNTDLEAFGTCFQTGFLDAILSSPDVRCIAARDDKSTIVGTLWGFFAKDQELFHSWELSRQAPLAHLGIAAELIACAKQQQKLYPHLKFATLNVAPDNAHAKTLYEAEQFQPAKEQSDPSKIFLEHTFSKDETKAVSKETAKTIVREFVMRSVPLYKLIFFELARRCEILIRAIWYR